MTPRFPALLLALAILLSPVAGYTFLMLCAPMLSFWWTPTLRLLFFVSLVDLLLFGTLFTHLGYRWLQTTPEGEEPPESKSWLGKALWIGGILYLASVGTYYGTQGPCYMLQDEARYHRSRGDLERARECEEAAYACCLEEGHDPAH